MFFKIFKKPDTSEQSKKHEIEPLFGAGEVDILARTIWGEARGEQLPGMEAVAAVVMNRLMISKRRGGHWWGSDVVSICQKPYQFSCWNEGDPNKDKLLAVREGDMAFDVAERIAKRALRGSLKDRTKGATHYHTRYLTPWWAKGLTSCAEIGNHVFYKDLA
ncbi:MAG: cell wall hydrolase [Alphaproteobacteria bacterium]|nr:cell wall hydrolase [Alphaproteobacteria bacterium]